MKDTASQIGTVATKTAMMPLCNISASEPTYPAAKSVYLPTKLHVKQIVVSSVLAMLLSLNIEVANAKLSDDQKIEILTSHMNCFVSACWENETIENRIKVLKKLEELGVEKIGKKKDKLVSDQIDKYEYILSIFD